MKRNLIFIILVMLFVVKGVNAECDNRTRLEINTAASNVTMDYTMDSVVLDTDLNLHPEISPEDVNLSESAEYVINDVVTLNVQNVTDKIYIVLQNDDDGINTEYHYSDLKNGTLKYEVPDTIKIRTYKLTIYSEVSDCMGEELRTIEVKTPKYNPLFMNCNGDESYYCQPYITTDVNVDEDEIYTDYTNDRNPSTNNSKENESNKNNVMKLLGIGVAVVLIIAIILMLIRYKKNKDNFMKNIGGM